jgi:hypothetical protein
MFMHCSVPVFFTLVMTARLCPRLESIESVQSFRRLFDDGTPVVRFTRIERRVSVPFMSEIGLAVVPLPVQYATAPAVGFLLITKWRSAILL